MKKKTLKQMLAFVLSVFLAAGSSMQVFAESGISDMTAAAEVQTDESATAVQQQETMETLTETEEKISEEMQVLTGDSTITENGIYQLAADASGKIAIETGVNSVTIVGKGTNYNVWFDCTAAEGLTLTLKNLNITNTDIQQNLIDFKSFGNVLVFDGSVVLKQSDTEKDGEFSLIHVSNGSELSLYGTTGSSVSLYADGLSAGIGGNRGEAGGIIILGQENGTNDFYLYAESSTQGSIIGNGTGCTGKAGDIIFYSGTYNLVSDAEQVLVGGNVGESAEASGTVFIRGGLLNFDIGGKGAAITDRVCMEGGLIRVYVNENAAAYWDMDQAGVNDAAILADKVNESGEELYLLHIDTADLEADRYTIKLDGEDYYQGPRYTYCEGETGLYLYASGKRHLVEVNDEKAYYEFDETSGTFEKVKLASQYTGKGTVSVSDQLPEKGDKVTVTAEPAEGYYLAQMRYEYPDGSEAVYEVLEKSNADGTYTLTMPSDIAVVSADFISIVWDGTIDLTWYNPENSTINIRYPAQLAAIAALDNGLFNNYPEVVNDDGNRIPYVGEDNLPFGYNESGYNLFEMEEDGTVTGQTAVVGDIHYLKAYCSTGTTGSNNQVTTDSFWYGADDFTGKTILLMNDLNMGGFYTGDDKTDVEAWEGPNYMPIGGQYCMNITNGFTHLGASFNGTLDGQGYAIYNVRCYRWGSSNYGDFASIGIIGRMGVHDNDPVSMRTDTAVRNLAVDGMFYGRRHVGAIVGKTGKTTSAAIENCINFAIVKGTDAKGASGICGAAWNGSTVTNCVNFGHVSTGYNKNAGGISGSCEAFVKNCYNFGYVGTTNSNIEAAQALGTNNGGCVWRNCYWLTGSSAAEKNPAVYNSTIADTFFEVTTPEEYKTKDFLDKLNGSERGWVLSSDASMRSEYVSKAMHAVSSYTKDLLAYDVMGMPIPRTFIRDNSVFTGIECTGTPVTSYIAGQVFNADTFKVLAMYSDDTSEEITDYEITYMNGGDCFRESDTKVEIFGTYRGTAFSYSFEVTVVRDTLQKLQVTTKPSNLLYAKGEVFDPAGMIVKATYSSSTEAKAITDYTFSPTGPLTSDMTEIVISYTYDDVTLTETVAIQVLDAEVPELLNGVVQLENSSDLLWFSNQVSLGNHYDAVLLNDIDASDVTWIPIGRKTGTPKYYTGVFDGNGKTITLNQTEAVTYAGLFGGIGSGGVVKNVTVEGTICGTTYTGAIAGRANGGTIAGCVNKAEITSSKNYLGGIVGYAAGDALILNNRNEGSVTNTGSSSYYTGGIAGYLAETEWIIDQCVNTGEVTAAGDVGGIAGRIAGSGSLINCMNQGSISSTYLTASYHAGGIAGNLYAAAVIDSCVNKGDVSGSTSLGGIAGMMYAAGSAVHNCYNTGNITGTANGTAYGLGGIVGKINNAGGGIMNCYSTGTVDAGTDNINTYAGGLAGSVKGYENIQNNYVLDSVVSESGLIGSTAEYTDVNVQVITADQLMTLADVDTKNGNSVLGDAYVSTAGAYPVLKWEETPEFAVTLEGNGALDVTAPYKADRNNDFSFTLNREEGFCYDIAVKIDGTAYEGWSQEEDVYTISAEDITGVISVYVRKYMEFSVTVKGNAESDVICDSVVEEGKDFSFRINEAVGYLYTVTITKEGEICDYTVLNGIYTIPGKEITANLIILVQKDKIQEAVSILKNPEDYSGAVGETAVFTISAKGEGLTYQWEYQNVGSSVWKASGQSGNKTDTLKVPITTARNGQKYRCVVTDQFANQLISDTVAIHVKEMEQSLTIMSQPEDYSGAVGETAVFTISAKGEGLTYQWEYQNVGSSVWKASGQSGSKTDTLKVPITEARNGQKYRCVITDQFGNQLISDTVAIHVKEMEQSLTIMSHPEDYTGAVGETAVFTVYAKGEGLTYQWEYQNAGSSVWKASGQSGSKTDTLKVPITEARNGQKYRCLITDVNGNTILSETVSIVLRQ